MIDPNYQPNPIVKTQLNPVLLETATRKATPYVQIWRQFVWRPCLVRLGRPYIMILIPPFLNTKLFLYLIMWKCYFGLHSVGFVGANLPKCLTLIINVQSDPKKNLADPVICFASPIWKMFLFKNSQLKIRQKSSEKLQFPSIEHSINDICNGLQHNTYHTIFLNVSLWENTKVIHMSSIQYWRTTMKYYKTLCVNMQKKKTFHTNV